MSNQRLTLYTNRYCPWAHRAHIALSELGLEFDEVSIDLSKPREAWYLAINPRGLVPALKIGDDEILIESGIITQYLADVYAPRLLPATGSAAAALQRARISLFVDVFASAFGSALTGILIAARTTAEKEAKAHAVVAAVKRDLVPLLADAAPFFGGSKELTLAEVNTASFVLRVYALGTEEYGWFPSFLLKELKEIEVWQKWVDALLAQKSVTAIWNQQENAEVWRSKLAKLEEERKV